MSIHSQLPLIESKSQTKQTTRTGTESLGGLSPGSGKGKNAGKGAGIKKYKLVGARQIGGW